MANNYENNIIDAIEQIVNNAVSKADYDRTVKATIVECVDQTIGKFKVKYQDSTFFAYATSSEVTYSKGSEVYILIPGNDTSRDKTILGTVKKLGADYAVTPEGDEAFEVVGNNCIHSSTTFELCSYKTTKEYVLYQRGASNNKISLDTKAVTEYFTKSSALICGAIFKTNIPNKQQYRGNYGIAFELMFTDNATGKNVLRNYIVDVNQMTGNPYSIKNETRQYGVFDIDGANFQYVNKIYLFCYDFPYQENNQPNDIFIKNIDFCGAVPMGSEELSGCAVTFITPQGIYFDNSDTDNATRTLQAQVRVKGKLVDKNSQSLEYYWFRENVGITTLHEKFNKYAGQGWECLNKSTVIKKAENGNAPIVEWISGDYQWTIKKSDTAAKKTKYKCIVIYNENTIISKEIEITNYSSNIDITIESDAGTKFYYDIGRPTLKVLINGQEKTEMTYAWAEVDNNNNFVGLAETTTLNNDYNNTLKAYNTLKTEIKNETKLAAANKQKLQEYENALKNYEIIQRVEGNKIYKVDVSAITNFKTFKVSVYSNGVYQGTSSIVLTNSYENEDAYSLVINNGIQVFKYNEDGIAPTHDSLEEPQTLLPLTFTIYDNLGQPISDDIAKQCNIQWIVPKKNTMISIDNSVYDGYKTAETEDTITYSGLLGISYTIVKKYNIKNINNNIKIIVDYKDMSLVNQTDFTFTKEGEPGTNGTEFIAKIVANVKDGIPPINPMILNGSPNYALKTSNRWFRVQFWHNGTKIFENTQSDTTDENKPITIEWSILQNTYNKNVYTSTYNKLLDNTDISIDAATGVCSYNGYHGADSPANIVKCTITYDEMTYYATLPVITAKTSSGYSVKLKDNTGFKFITYSPDGRTPSYANSNPFELLVTQVINGVTEDISKLTKTYAVDYDWQVRGCIWNPDIQKWVSKSHLAAMNINGLKRNEKQFKPIDGYDDETVNNGIECIITRDSSEIARIHIPIHLLLNKYGNAAINGWDGNSVSIDENGSGVILAPQMGAGQKEKDDNSFTGVLMGKVKEAGKSFYDIGVLGYNHGQRTIFLDSEDGSATFGKLGNGQIILDPKTDKAMIYSYGFWKNYTNKNKPTNYGSSNYNGQGLLIDLTTPEIRFGSGNFIVNKEGHITAKGGGTIAGWNIDDDALFTGTKNSNSNVQISSKNFSRTINGTNRDDWRMAFSNNFGVSSGGVMHATSGIIGSGTNKITLGKSSGDGAQSAIYSGSKSAFAAAANGFYVGNDGIALGIFDSNKGTSPFQVNSAGAMSARSGYIAGYAIADNTLIGGSGSNCVGISSKSGVQWAFWAGNEDAGSAPFHVGHNGSLYASKASIEGEITATSGVFKNCIIEGSCTIGGVRVDADFVKNANIASNAVTEGKIAANAVTSDKIQANAVTADKINVNSLSAVSGKFGGVVSFGTGSYIDGTQNLMQWSNNTGFLSMGTVSTHPYMSACNVSSVNGISFRNSNSVTSIGSQNGSIKCSGDTMILNADIVRIDASIATYQGGNNHIARGYTYFQVQTGTGQTARLTFYNGLLCVATGDTGISGVRF